LVTLAVIALVVRLGWALLMMDRVPQFDEVEYIDLASRLAAGEGYVDETGARVAYWPAGYPALLSWVFRLSGGPSEVGAVALQIALGIATCLLLSVVGSRVVGSGAGRLAGLLLALYPTHVMYSTLRLTEPLFTLLMLGALGILSLARQPGVIPAIVAGLVLGAAVLTRPLIVLLPFVLPLLLATKGQRRGRALSTAFLVLLTALLTVSPWLWRNHQLTGRWTSLTTSGGFNFWVGNNPEARGGYIRQGEIDASLAVGDEFDWHRGYSMGFQAIREDPLRALGRLPLKISHLVALETDGVLWNLKGFTPRPGLPTVLWLLFLANVAYLLALGTATLALLGRKDLPLFGRMTVLLCVYMLAIVVVSFWRSQIPPAAYAVSIVVQRLALRGRRGMAMAPF
jgi:4-amino-4-deoxy-L-arabinose transferase-like glycosyltransferase